MHNQDVQAAMLKFLDEDFFHEENKRKQSRTEFQKNPLHQQQYQKHEDIDGQECQYLLDSILSNNNSIKFARPTESVRK